MSSIAKIFPLTYKGPFDLKQVLLNTRYYYIERMYIHE